jgi:hippurate hydrolase
MNPEVLYRRVREILPFRELAEPNMASEDFSFYQKHTQAMFFFLGLGDVPALHSADFDFDETVLTRGADFFETLVRNF